MRWLHNLSFKARIFWGCLLVAMVPLIFSSLVMIRLFSASVRRQVAEEGLQQVSEINSRLSQLLENSETACRNLTEDGTAAWVLIDNKSVQIQKDLYLSLYQAVQEIYSNAQFNIYDAGGKLRFTTDTSPKNNFLPTNWGLLKKASQRAGMTYYRTDPYLPSTDNSILMQGAYSLESTHGARMGYVVLDFGRDNFDNLFNGFYGYGDVVVLLDSHQQAIYCSRPEYGEREIAEILRQAMSGGGAGNDEEYTQYFWAQEPKHGFNVLLRHSAPITAPAVRIMQTVSLSLAGLGLILCMIISGALTRSISQPVSQLDKAMAKVKKGDLSVRVRMNRQDEIGRLGESFNRMTADLQKYLDDTVQKQKDLNETTLKLYQTQLNPHFIYNTLDTIKWNAKINQIPESAILAENLAVILRRSISSSPFVQLRKELETIESYIQIQKIRFTGRFLFETEIPDQLEVCMVPKMILQPLVENAIIHGLDGCENGYICIYAAQSDGLLRISVADDGCGMNPEMVAWINSDKPAKREGHLGLYNVIHILKIYYGPEYGLKAVVTEEGTTVTVTLPAATTQTASADRKNDEGRDRDNV